MCAALSFSEGSVIGGFPVSNERRANSFPGVDESSRDLTIRLDYGGLSARMESGQPLPKAVGTNAPRHRAESDLLR